MQTLDRLIDNPDGDVTVYIYYVESKRGKFLCDVSLTPITMYDEKPIGSTLSIISEPVVDEDKVEDTETSSESDNSLYTYIPKSKETLDTATDSDVLEDTLNGRR